MSWSDVLGLALVLLPLGALLLLAEWLGKRGWVEVEYTRKLVHLGGGVVVYFLPHVFNSHWPVLVLALVFLTITALSQRLGKLSSVHGVERSSVGAWVYPISVYVLFVLARGDALRFQIPILILAFSDAFGAIVGKTYGVVKYKVMDQIRSLEGSTAFFVVAFLVTHIPLLLSSQAGRLEAVLIGVILALLVTCFEAISLGGSDNVLIPFGAYFALNRLLALDAPALEIQALALAVLIVLILISSRFQQLSASGAIGALLVGYACWALGGLAFFLPMAVFYLTYNLLNRLLVRVAELGEAPAAHERQVYEISAIFYISITSVALVLLHDVWPAKGLFMAYLVSVGASSAISWATLLPSQFFKGLREVLTPHEVARHFGGGVELLVTLLGAALPLVPLLFLPGPYPLEFWSVTAIVLCGVLGVALKGGVGVTLMARYQCARCQALVSKPMHCGQEAQLLSGLPWLNLDRAHLLAVAAAAALGALLLWH